MRQPSHRTDRALGTIPSKAIPAQPSAAGGVQLGSKPSMASQSKTTQPLCLPPLEKWGCRAAPKATPGHGGGGAGQGGQHLGIRVACLEFSVVP